MKKTIMCIAQGESHADSLVKKLLSAGFLSGEISVLSPARDRALEPTLECKSRSQRAEEDDTHSTEGSAGTLSFAAPSGAFTLPEIGAVIAAGPLLAALNETVGKTAIDRLIGSLIKLGILESEARLYAGKVQTGKVLVAVDTHGGNEPKRAAAIFMVARALDLRETSEVAVPRMEAASIGAHFDGF